MARAGDRQEEGALEGGGGSSRRLDVPPRDASSCAIGAAERREEGAGAQRSEAGISPVTHIITTRVAAEPLVERSLRLLWLHTPVMLQRLLRLMMPMIFVVEGLCMDR
ncbi:unnamed protein product [Lampetra fluviatilis]